MTVAFPNFPDADIVLRSSTPCREFPVHKERLSSSSAFFNAMFSLPQSEGESSRLQVVDVAENARTLETLLGITYSIPNIPIDAFDDLELVMEAAHKYDLHTAIASLRFRLVAPQFLGPDPLRVYAIARRFDLDEEANLASQHSLQFTPVEIEQLLAEETRARHVTSQDVRHILDVHRSRAEAALRVIAYDAKIKCKMCNGDLYYSMHSPPRWWIKWEEWARQELAERPTSDAIFSDAFLAKTADGVSDNAGRCSMCKNNIASDYVQSFLQKMKARIDSLEYII